MKKIILFSIMLTFVLSSSLYAAERSPLGIGNLSVKLDYINFTENALEDLDIDKGLYVGLESYTMLFTPNLLLGVEVGYVKTDGEARIFDEDLGIEGDIDTDLTYVPVELNLKYVFEPGANLVMDFGIGGSYNYYKVEQKLSSEGIRIKLDDDDWLWGGQIFADLNYKNGEFFMGVNGKYQITEEVKDSDVNFNNWRVGGHIGVRF